MAKQWGGVLASQTVHFRGTSRVNVMEAGAGAQNFRTISRAVYSLTVTGGVSGSFGAHILGYVGNTTVVVAGLTSISAVGSYIMYPVGYSSTGAQGLVGAVSLGVNAINRLDWTVPPTAVVFQSGVATAGISATCSVAAHIHQEG